MGSHSTGFFEESEPAAVFAVLLSVGTEFVHLLDSGFSAYLPDQRHLQPLSQHREIQRFRWSSAGTAGHTAVLCRSNFWIQAPRVVVYSCLLF